MGLWSVIVPELTAVTNLVTNPSLELGTTGYAAMAGAISWTATRARRGLYSLLISPAAGVNDGAYYGTVTLTIGVTYTASVDFFGAAGVPYRIYFGSTVGAVLGTPTTFTGTGDWQRVTVTWTETAGAARRLYVTKNNSISTAGMYVDGVQVVALSHDTMYIDGYRDDCVWNGTPHASTSTRLASSRAGQEISFDTYGDIIVEASAGPGLPSNKHLVQNQPLLPGALFQGRKILPRTLILRISVGGSTRENLHLLRKSLVDAIKPDLTPGDRPVTVRTIIANSNKPVEIDTYYDSGLEQSQAKGFSEDINLRLIAYDPFWREIGEAAKSLTLYGQATMSRIATKSPDGAWTGMTPGFDNTVEAIAVGPDGRVYAGGTFLNSGATAVSRIAVWDGSTWSALGAGLNAEVTCMAFGPDGYLYVGGLFTTAGGGAALKIAKWDGANWSAVGGGVTTGTTVTALAFGPDGLLYISGSFTQVGGVACTRVAKWDGAAWSALSTGLSDQANVIITGPDGYIYLGGAFTTAGGVSCSKVAKWNGTAFSALGSTFGGDVYGLDFGPDGLLYAGGLFTTIAGVTVNYAAKWNGATWQALGSGLNGNVLRMKNVNGYIWAAGAFTTAGGMPASRLAVWNGTSWVSPDILLPGSAIVYDMVYKPDGTIYVGFDTTGTATYSGQTTISNTGTRTTYPVFIVSRSAVSASSAICYYLKNETTGSTIWLYYSLAAGETLTIDFRPGKRSIKSSMFGDVTRAVLRGSDMADFSLLPGSNSISLMAYSASNAYMTWKIQHWSVDGVAV